MHLNSVHFSMIYLSGRNYTGREEQEYSYRVTVFYRFMVKCFYFKFHATLVRWWGNLWYRQEFFFFRNTITFFIAFKKTLKFRLFNVAHFSPLHVGIFLIFSCHKNHNYTWWPNRERFLDCYVQLWCRNRPRGSGSSGYQVAKKRRGNQLRVRTNNKLEQEGTFS